MEFIRHAEKSIALLTPEDLSGDEKALAGLIDRALAQGCSCFILPADIVKRGLSLLKGGLIEALRQRFSASRFRAAITGPLTALQGLAVRSLVRAYGIGDSVFFADNIEEALDKLGAG